MIAYIKHAVSKTCIMATFWPISTVHWKKDCEKGRTPWLNIFNLLFRCWILVLLVYFQMKLQKVHSLFNPFSWTLFLLALDFHDLNYFNPRNIWRRVWIFIILKGNPSLQFWQLTSFLSVWRHITLEPMKQNFFNIFSGLFLEFDWLIQQKIWTKVFPS